MHTTVQHLEPDQDLITETELSEQYTDVAVQAITFVMIHQCLHVKSRIFHF